MAESSGRIKTIKSDEDFEKELREAGDRLVIVDFFSDDCVYSEAMTNTFFQLSERYHEAVFLKLDMDTCRDTLEKYRVHSTPTYLFFKERTELRRVRGAGGERLEGAIMSQFRSSTTEVAVPEGQMDLSFLLDSNQCECLNDDDDHPFKNALKPGAEYLESDCDEQLIITLAFKHPVKLHSIQLTGPNDGRAPKTVKLFINLPPCQTPSFDDAERMQPLQELSLTEDDVTDDAVLSLKFVKFQTVNSLTIFVKDNQGMEETTVINHIRLFGTPRDITKANLRETPSPESDEDEDLETILLLYIVRATQGLINTDVLEQKEEGSENLSVIEKITPHWRKFADAIEMEPQTCEQIAAADPDDAQACCKAMFQEWLDGEANFPPIWDVLLAKLIEINLDEIAMQLEEILEKEAEEDSTDEDEAQVVETNQDEAQVEETDEDEAQTSEADQAKAQAVETNQDEAPVHVGETDEGEAQASETDQAKTQAGETNQDEVQVGTTDQVEAQVGETNLDKAKVGETDQDKVQVGETDQDEVLVGETDQNETQMGTTNQDEAQVRKNYQDDTKVEGIDQDEAQVGEADQDETQVEATNQNEAKVHATDQEFLEEEEQQTKVQHFCPNICARTAFHISGNGHHNFVWRKHGFKLQVPEDALPAGQTQCDVHITTTLPRIRQLNLPDNSIPVSAFYDISTTQKFSLPVTVEIQHCAKASQYASLSFVISRNKMPFEYLEGGEFPADTSYGRIAIAHFSCLGIILREVVLQRETPPVSTTTSAQPTTEPPTSEPVTSEPHTSEPPTSEPLTSEPLTSEPLTSEPPAEPTVDPCERCYCSQIFQERRKSLKWTVHFIITCNLEVCKTRLETEFEKLNAEPGPHQEIEFEKNMITLEIPREGIFVQDGWRLCPLTHPAITKKRVDDFQCGQWIPSCQLDVTWTKNKSPEKELFHKIDLTGAKEPFNFFTVICNPTPQGADSVTPTTELKACHMAKDERPDLLKLLNLRGKSGNINIPQRISTKYFMFGVLLLNDGTGAEVSSIVKKYHDDAEQINCEILRLWIGGKGKPLSWDVLTDVLKAIGLNTLANDIQDSLEH